MSNLVKIILGLVLVVLVGVFVFTHFHMPANVPVPQTQSHGLVIAPMVTDNAKVTYTDIEMSYPQSSATSLPEIFNFVQSTKNDFVKNYGSPSAADIKMMNLRQDFPYQLMMTTKVATSSQTVSYIISTYEFTGGAHGNTIVSTFTYDTNGKSVTLNDVFTGNYLSVIAPMSRTYFYKTIDPGYMNKEMIDPGTEATTTNFSVWYLTDKTVTFIFQQYQVGPYVIGIQEFPIDKSQIVNILNSKYK